MLFRSPRDGAAWHRIRTTVGRAGGSCAAGVRNVLSRLTATRAARGWVVNIDADSVMPPRWLTHHLGQADGGDELLLGASLGVRASAYCRAGCFESVAVHEDVRLAAEVGADH